MQILLTRFGLIRAASDFTSTHLINQIAQCQRVLNYLLGDKKSDFIDMASVEAWRGYEHCLANYGGVLCFTAWDTIIERTSPHPTGKFFAVKQKFLRDRGDVWIRPNGQKIRIF